MEEEQLDALQVNIIVCNKKHTITPRTKNRSGCLPMSLLRLPAGGELVQVTRLCDHDAAAGRGVGLLGALGYGIVDLVLDGLGVGLHVAAHVGVGLVAEVGLGLVEDAPRREEKGTC